jgi:excisionase family DNA binding protein
MPTLLSHVLKSITLFGLSQGTINLQAIAEVNMDTLLSVTEAAKRLGGISKWTVHAWLSKGRLQRTKVGGRTMIRESELAKIIKDGGKSAAPRRISTKTSEKR